MTVSLAKRAASTMRKNAVAIKEEILRFVKANTDDYEVLAFATRSPPPRVTMGQRGGRVGGAPPSCGWRRCKGTCTVHLASRCTVCVVLQCVKFHKTKSSTFFFFFSCRLGLYSHCHGNAFSPQVSLSVLSEPQVVLGGLGWERC